MPHLALTLLGGFAATLDGQLLTAFGTDKARALLAYLAVEASRPHQRTALAALFWPDLPQAKAGHNLSQTLVRVRRAVREVATQPWLSITSQHVQLNPIGDYQLDVTRFTELLTAVRQHTHAQAETCRTCLAWLAQAADLYRGDFLAGFSLRDNLAFEEWQLIQQEVLRRQAIEVLSRLATYHDTRGEYELVQRYAGQLVSVDPWHEQGHLNLMRALALKGEAAAALEKYVVYSRTLSEEFGLLPSAEMTSLFKQIQTGQIRPGTQRPVSGRTAQPSERRQITALVCSRRDPTGSLDPEELQQRMAQCGPRCQQILDRYGGHRQHYQGDGCLVYFGYPQAYEDAARRAVHAGLAMVAANEAPDAVHVGIHTGLMVVSERQSAGSPRYDLVGGVPGVAGRGNSLAEPGSVVMTEDTERLVRGWFDYQSLGVQSLASLPQALEFHRVRGARAGQSHLAWLAQLQHLTPLVGRQHELKQMAAHLLTAVQGHGQVIAVCGESGMGKSRLIWELRQIDVSSATWLESHCLPYFQNTSLYPMIKLLEQLLGFANEANAAVKQARLNQTLRHYGLDQPASVWLMALLLGLPTETSAPTTITAPQREHIRETFVSLLHSYAAEQPLVLVIEDLHWADPSSIEWLAASLDALAGTRCLVLLNYRPTFNPPWLLRPHVHSLELAPLNQAEVEQMVSKLIGAAALPDDLRRRIIAHSDGTPLFVEELGKMLLEAGSSSPSVDVPGTLRDSLLARLDRVGAARETASWAAALGREFDYAVLAAVVPYHEARLQADLTTLIEVDLINVPRNPVDTLYSFKHALIQEAAHTSLLKRTRQDYHRRIAEIYAARFPHLAATQPEVLAEHYDQAGLPDQAVALWLQAGERATAQGATREATTFFDRALLLIGPNDRERRWRALSGREIVLNFREAREAQKQDIEALLALAEADNDDTRRAEALLRQYHYVIRFKDFPVALRITETAVAVAARAGNLTLEVRALVGKAQTLSYMGKGSAVRQTIEQALAKMPGIEDDLTRAFVLGHLGFCYMRAGDSGQALALLHQGVTAARQVGDRQKESRFDINIGFVYIQLGCYAQACATLEAGLALAEALGDQATQSTIRYNLSYAYWRSGDRDKAQLTGEQALMEFKLTGTNTLAHACCLEYLGTYRAELGEWTAAVAYLAQARTMYDSIEMHALKMEAQAIEARCLLALGRQAEAQRLAAEVWTYVGEQGTEGIDFPAQVYGCIADVAVQISTLEITEHDVLSAGYAELMRRAEMIDNPEWRQSFLQNVAENRALIEQWQQSQSARPIGP